MSENTGGSLNLHITDGGIQRFGERQGMERLVKKTKFSNLFGEPEGNGDESGGSQSVRGKEKENGVLVNLMKESRLVRERRMEGEGEGEGEGKEEGRRRGGEVVWEWEGKGKGKETERQGAWSREIEVPEFINSESHRKREFLSLHFFSFLSFTLLYYSAFSFPLLVLLHSSLSASLSSSFCV